MFCSYLSPIQVLLRMSNRPFGPFAHRRSSSYTRPMEVYFAPDLQSRIDQLVLETGRPANSLLEDALAGYVPELAQTRDLLDRRYDDLKSDRVQLMDGEEAFSRLMARTDAQRD